jgi:hypothetical protein
VHEQVVLLVRDLNCSLKSAQIHFKEVIINPTSNRTELKSI